MSKRSPLSRALHDGFDRYLLPALAPLGFVRAEVPTEHRAVGWTVAQGRVHVAFRRAGARRLWPTGTSPPRFTLAVPLARSS